MWAGEAGSLALQLLSGAAVTSELFLGAVPVLLLLAVLAGAARLSTWRLLRLLALGYIAFFRGTSALVQLFWLFYALPLLGVTLPAMAVEFSASAPAWAPMARKSCAAPCWRCPPRSGRRRCRSA